MVAEAGLEPTTSGFYEYLGTFSPQKVIAFLYPCNLAHLCWGQIGVKIHAYQKRLKDYC